MSTWSTPRSEMGQAVERTYGWVDGRYYRRTHDRSDGLVQWHVADEASADALGTYEAGGAMEPPNVAEWIGCDEPVEDDE